MLATMIVKDVSVRTRIGVTEEERNQKPELQIDVDYKIELGETIDRDDLDRFVDYDKVADLIHLFAKESDIKFLETFTYKLLKKILNIDHIVSAKVHVRKLRVPSGAAYASCILEAKAS